MNKIAYISWKQTNKQKVIMVSQPRSNQEKCHSFYTQITNPCKLCFETKQWYWVFNVKISAKLYFK